MTDKNLDIIIVGGGIAGLATALALHQAGFKPTVYEAAPELKPLGVGINLLPHAMRELTELGLLEDLRRIGVEIEDLSYLTKHGKAIWSFICDCGTRKELVASLVVRGHTASCGCALTSFPSPALTAPTNIWMWASRACTSRRSASTESAA